MTILTNTEINDLVNNVGLITDFESGQLQPASYDLRIGTVFKGGEIINSAHPKGKKPIVIKPGEVVTMLTREELHLPTDIAATAYAMNSQSSDGLLVLNPGHVDPGYKGPLSMVAVNLRKADLPLLLDDPIFTLVFDKLQMHANPAYPNTSSGRTDRERKTNKQVIERSIVSLGELMALNSPFATEKRVGELILKHWMTWVITIAALVAAVFAVLSVVHPSSPSVATDVRAGCSERLSAAGPLVVIQTALGAPVALKVRSALSSQQVTTVTAKATKVEEVISSSNDNCQVQKTTARDHSVEEAAPKSQ